MRKLLLLMLSLLALASCRETGSGLADSAQEPDLLQEDAAPDLDHADAPALEDSSPDTALPLTQPAFASPQAILALPDQGLVLVSNTNGAWDNELFTMVYGPGFVSVLDQETLLLVQDLTTSAVNPQALARTAEGVAVLCSGTSVFDENWTASPGTPGALDFFGQDLGFLGTLPLPNDSAGEGSGFPTSLVAVGDRLFVGSGISPAIWAVDPVARTLLTTVRLHEQAGNELLTLFDADGALGVLGFNSETLTLLDPSTLLPLAGACDYPVTLDDRAQTLTGPQSAVFKDGRIYILNALTSTLSVFDPATCKLTSDAAVLGGAPNHLVADDDALLVVNSLDNNLQRLTLPGLESTAPFAILPPGCNPWNAALLGDRVLVSGYLDQRLYATDRADGELLFFVPEAP